MIHPAQLPIEVLLQDCALSAPAAVGRGASIATRSRRPSSSSISRPGSGRSFGAAQPGTQSPVGAAPAAPLGLALEVRSSGVPVPLSPLWESRTAGGKLAVNKAHADFRGVLAEALDGLADCQFDLAASAARIGVSSSQLVKFLKIEPAALALVNRHRQLAGLNVLR